MYAGFLEEIASHGYFAVAPGRPFLQSPGFTSSAWQTASIDYALKWDTTEIKLDRSKIGIGGHSCGATETANTAGRDRRVKTAIIANGADNFGSGGAGGFECDEAKLSRYGAPTLWVHGGPTDGAVSLGLFSSARSGVLIVSH